MNWKDVPQDAAGIVSWWECMQDIHGRESTTGSFQAGPSLEALGPDRLRELGHKYDAEYAVIPRRPDLPAPLLPSVYSNSGYTVVRLRDQH